MGYNKPLPPNKKATGLKSLANVMKADKAADAKMGPKQIKADIAADKKNLASKTKKK